MGVELLGIGGIWWGLGAAVAVGTSVGTTAYSTAVEKSTANKQMNAEKENQDKLIAVQEKQVADAEAKATAADALALATAEQTAKKRRLAQTKTILTSPLGLSNEGLVTGTKRLMGGS